MIMVMTHKFIAILTIMIVMTMTLPSYTKNAHIYFIDVHLEFANTSTHHNDNSDCTGNERTRTLGRFRGR